MYITASDKGRVRKVNLEGAISTIAGTGIPGVSGDGGNPLLAYISRPTGIIVAENNDIFICDRFGAMVRMISNHIVSIPEVVNNSKDLIIFPNPTFEYCTIQVNCTNAEPIIITIKDITGKPVHRCTGTTRQPITIATCWQPGIYTVSAATATEQHTTTIVVQ
jgi:hypothetical protein